MMELRTPTATRSIQSVFVLANAEKPAAQKLIAELEPWLRARVTKDEVRADVRAFHEERAAERLVRGGSQDQIEESIPRHARKTLLRARREVLQTAGITQARCWPNQARVSPQAAFAALAL